MHLTKFAAALLALFLCVALLACGNSPAERPSPAQTGAVSAIAIGEGAHTFAFTATFLDGTQKHYSVSTDCATVGEALLALDLIDGEAGQFGLYIKSVCGVTADYDKDKTYWALYTDGEMAMTGIDGIAAADAPAIELRVSK